MANQIEKCIIAKIRTSPNTRLTLRRLFGGVLNPSFPYLLNLTVQARTRLRSVRQQGTAIIYYQLCAIGQVKPEN